MGKSWKAHSTLLVDVIQQHDELTTNSKRELVDLVEGIQKSVVEAIEEAKRVHGDHPMQMVDDLKKRVAELEHSLAENNKYSHSKESELLNSLKKAEKTAGKYRKKYQRAFGLVLSLSRLMAEHEQEEME